MPIPEGRRSSIAVPSSLRPWRSAAAVACAVLGLGVAAAAFWQLDLRYASPTPAPADRVEVERGRRVDLPPELARAVRAAPGPTLLHLFNPDCPCSRFNLEHVLSIARAHDGRARVIAVLQGTDAAAARSRFDELDTGLVAVTDADGSIAASVGAYSTPQAAIVDAEQRLAWRGNYNTSRYCRDRATEYARIALEHVIAGRVVPDLGPAATRAYGCELPSALEEGT